MGLGAACTSSAGARWLEEASEAEHSLEAGDRYSRSRCVVSRLSEALRREAQLRQARCQSQHEAELIKSTALSSLVAPVLYVATLHDIQKIKRKHGGKSEASRPTQAGELGP